MSKGNSYSPNLESGLAVERRNVLWVRLYYEMMLKGGNSVHIQK